MGIRTAHVEWTGDFRNGRGTIEPGSGAFSADYCSGSIVGDEPGTNPTEILAAALAGCLSSTLAGALARGGYSPKRILTDARAHLENIEGVYSITRIELNTKGKVPDIDDSTFKQYAERIAKGCPVGKALASVEIILNAELL